MNEQAWSPAPVGHLARLVERVIPTEPTLRRRQPALFESSHLALAEPAPDSADTRVIRRDVATTAAESAASPMAARTPPAPVETPLPSTHRPPQGPSLAAVTAPPAMPHAAPRVDPTIRVVMAEAPVRITPPSSPTASAPAAAPRTPAPLPERPAPPGATRSRPAPALEHEATPAPRRAPVPPAEAPMAYARTAAHATLATTLTPHRPGCPLPLPAATRPPPAPPALLPRNAARRQAAAVPQPAPRAAARELPPIEVTIGRIEVRAVTGAPSAPRSTTSSAPKLSLDQYLRDRGGQR